MPDTYSQVPTYQNIETPFQAQDYSFLQYAMQNKESQYEQGASQVKNLYNSVLTAPISNPENVAARAQYVQEANVQMQKLAKSDLSMPQNVSQAQKVFAPFWQDNDIVADIYHTRQIQNQKQVGQQQLESTDEKIRDQYNPNSIALLDYSTLDLQRAKRGNGSLQNVKVPNYVPKVDIGKYASDSDAKDEFKGVNEDVDMDSYIVTYKNGARAHLALKTRYTGIIGDKFGAQMGVDGTLQRRQLEEEIRRQNPNISDTDMTSALSKYVYSKLSTNYQDSLTKIKNDIESKLDTKINLLTKYIQEHPDEKGPQQEYLASLQEQKNDQLTKLANTFDEYTDFVNKHPDQKIGDIERNPDDYFSRLARQTTIDDLVGKRESDRAVTYKSNPRWDALDKQAEWVSRDQIARNASIIAQQRIAADVGMNALTERTKAGIAADPKGFYAAIYGNLPGVNGSSIPGSHFMGAATGDVEHQTVPEIIQSQQSTRMAIANNEIIKGVTPILVNDGLHGEKGGITSEELTPLNTYLSRYFSAGGESTNPSPEEYAVLKKASQFLSDNLNRSIPVTPVEVRKALLEYSTKERNTRASIGIVDNTHMAAYQATKRAEKVIDEYNHVDQISRQYQKDLLNKNPKRYEDLPTEENITRKVERLLFNSPTSTSGEFVPASGAHTLTIKADDGTIKTINSSEIAKAYLENSFHNIAPVWKEGATPELPKISYYGKNYHILKHGDTPISPYGVMSPTSSLIEANIKQTFTPEKAQKANTILKEDIARYFPQLKKQTEVTGSMFEYPVKDPDNQVLPGTGYQLVKEAFEPANKDDILVNGKSLNTYSDPDTKYHAIKSMIGNMSQFLEDGSAVNVVEGINSQTPHVKFQIKNDPKKYGDLAGTEVTVQLSSNASGDVISKLPSQQSFHVYHNILTGTPYKTSVDDEALGARLSITVDNTDHPTEFRMNTWKQSFDPKGKVWIWRKIDDNVSYPINSISPDGLVQLADGWVQRAIAERQANQQIINKGTK